MFYQRELESPRPWPLTVRMPSRVVAVMRRRSAVAMSFFTVSSMLRPQTTRTREFTLLILMPLQDVGN